MEVSSETLTRENINSKIPIGPQHARACSTLPKNITFTNSSQLNNPFLFLNNTPVITQADFVCRQQELSTLLQTYELGTIPGKPDSFNATFSKNTITIKAGVGKNNISFAPTITYPSSGQAPYPAIIGIDGISIPTPSGVAVVTLNVDDLAQQNDQTSRGVGKFYTLYGKNATAGAMAAWSWGVSRLIDALEALPATNIDTTRLAVSGCSRDGKGALVAGAFDNRIALTIPQESGSGGASCWRLSDYMLANGIDTQTASEIVQENVWFGPAFNKWANTSIDPLPFDHHLLAALIAPRALFVIENTAYDWLGPWSSYGCMLAAHQVWQALSVNDHMGYSELGNHSHCMFPSAQQPYLDAFVNRFLRGETVDTDIFTSDIDTSDFHPQFTIPGKFANWSSPVLY
jgi:hypothetical protein